AAGLAGFFNAQPAVKFEQPFSVGFVILHPHAHHVPARVLTVIMADAAACEFAQIGDFEDVFFDAAILEREYIARGQVNGFAFAVCAEKLHKHIRVGSRQWIITCLDPHGIGVGFHDAPSTNTPLNTAYSTPV